MNPLSLAAGNVSDVATPPETVDAAAAAGYWGAGVWFDPSNWTDATAADVRRRLDATGVVALDIEPVRLEKDPALADRLVDAGAQVGAANILAISNLPERSATVDAFARLCQRAAPAGMTVVLEFMKFTAVRSLADAVSIVRDADQPNAGVLIDTLHLDRAGDSVEQVAEVDPALLPYAQWCDGPAEPGPDLYVDALDDRCNPGEGDLPVKAFVDALPAGIPLSPEIRSKALRERYPSPVERARAIRTACEGVLAHG